MTYTGDEKHDARLRKRHEKKRLRAEKKGEYQIKGWALRRDEDGRSIMAGRPLSLKKKRPSWMRKISDYDRQVRLVFCAGLIRKGYSTQEVVQKCMEEWGLGLQTTRKYVRRVYEEFQAHYKPEQKVELLVDHLETLKGAIQHCHELGDMKSMEPLLRQYAECVGILTPASLIKFQQTDNRQQLIQIGDPKAAALTLEKLEGMSTHDLLSHLLPERISGGIEAETGRIEPGAEARLVGEP